MLDIGKRTLFFYFYGKANIFASGKLSSLSRCFRKVFMALPLLQKSFHGFPFALLCIRKVSMAFPCSRKAFMTFPLFQESFVTRPEPHNVALQPGGSIQVLWTSLKSDKS